MAYNNENGGVIERLKEDGLVDLDVGLCTLPDWVSTKAMLVSWLTDAIMYELWLGSDGTSASKIYYSDIPWPIGKILFVKQVYFVKQRLGIDKGNADKVEETVRLFSESLGNNLNEIHFSWPSLYCCGLSCCILAYPSLVSASSCCNVIHNCSPKTTSWILLHN